MELARDYRLALEELRMYIGAFRYTSPLGSVRDEAIVVMNAR